MWERVEARLADVARRAGLKGVAPRAVAAAIVVAILAIGLGLWRWWPRGTDSAPVLVEATSSTASATASASLGSPETTETAVLVVHVVGSVRRPGVYILAPGDRVIDAIEAAGGLLGDAEARAINLARPLADGEQIVVPSHDEAAKGQSAGVAGGGNVGSGGAGSTGVAGSSAQTPLNINTADAAALDTLPGVGPSTAQKIIADREANGAFASVEDLGRVSGIGPKKLEQFKGLVSVR